MNRMTKGGIGVVVAGLLAMGAAIGLKGMPSGLSFSDARRQEGREGAAVKPVGSRPHRSGTYADELARLDRELASGERRARVHPESWMTLDQLAGGYLRRARLTGDYEDYARATSALERSFAIPGAVPFMTRAGLNFSLHRLEPALRDLELAERPFMKDDRTQAALIGLRADIALQRGEYTQALEGFQRSNSLHRSITGLSRLANYHWKAGEFVYAFRYLNDAEALYVNESPMEPAWFDLQRGLMALDQGKWDEALTHYRNADDHLSGWWLVGEHIAEVQALLGQTEEAKVAYEQLIQKTGNPEFMDALAGIHQARGEDAMAKGWIEKARTAYEARLDRFPEATWGHALDHFLEFAPDPKDAVLMAEQNHTLRPGGEAKVKLAEAYLKAGKAEQARALVETTLSGPYRSAALFTTAAEVYGSLGDQTRADDMKSRALRINPHAL